MSVLLKKIWQTYDYVLYDLGDERTRDLWPHFSTMVTILSVYLYFCKVAGPAWMKDRKPFDLKTPIFYYNIFQILVSVYIFYEGVGVFSTYNWTCQPVIYTPSPEIEKAQFLAWLYTVVKLIDLLDTVFFVLRKKSRQISGLHLYHHFMMPICSWIGLKYYPNGHSTLLGLINSLVHAVMYTYYLIAGLGPQYQKYLWWKKHVTTIQLVQFLIIFIHNMCALAVGCAYPKWINVTLGLCSLHFVYMFGNFYYENYIKPRPMNCNQKLKST